jgi:hypothetical protein
MGSVFVMLIQAEKWDKEQTLLSSIPINIYLRFEHKGKTRTGLLFINGLLRKKPHFTCRETGDFLAKYYRRIQQEYKYSYTNILISIQQLFSLPCTL